MGDVISSHLDEGKRGMITARTRAVLDEFGKVYEQQYAVALFNSVRFEIEGGGGPQSQLLHRKDPLKDKSIFSGGLYQYLEENKKWRNRFLYVAESYNISFYENKQAHDRGLQPKGIINCAGYKALSSMEEYLELINSSLPGLKAKANSSPFLKTTTRFPLILWHPYARHHFFCVMTEKEQKKWHAVFQDCVRHSNNGLSDDYTVLTPAFTDSLRLYRQSKGHYGTWDMMCGEPPQILANLVMETLHPELRDLIVPRLKGKTQQRQRNWMLISDAVYRQVLSQTRARYEALVQVCEGQRPLMEASLRTDMDQIITSKEHVFGKIRALVSPKAEQLKRTNVQPYINSILEALMEPTSRGFSEVRDTFFRELVAVSKNTLNDGGKKKMAEHMDRISMLAFHPVKMQSAYEKVEQLSLEGLQQRFDVSGQSVFVHRAQILMREQMDNAVYTFEQLLKQSLDASGGEDLCKTIQRCQDRVLKKYDYDSSTVRKKFFREALLQIIIPHMLKQLSPSFTTDLPKFQELIFEDFSRFILVENVFEEVVLQSVIKDIKMAVKEAAVQRRHNLFRDSIVLTNSDPNLHLLGENTIDWEGQLSGVETRDNTDGQNKKRRQIVSMIQLEGMPLLPYESCLEVPGVEGIPEENEGQDEDPGSSDEPCTPTESASIKNPESPDSVQEIRALINPVVEVVVPNSEKENPLLTNGTVELEEVEEVTTRVKNSVSKGDTNGLPQDENHVSLEIVHSPNTAQIKEVKENVSAIESAIQEIEIAVQENDSELLAVDSDVEIAQPSTDSKPHNYDDSGFQSPSNEAAEEEVSQPITEQLDAEGDAADPDHIVVAL